MASDFRSARQYFAVIELQVEVKIRIADSRGGLQIEILTCNVFVGTIGDGSV